MRIDELELTAFGPFTDLRLVLADSTEAGARLHVIYGPNEAGKSSALRALRALLFGIAHQSSDAFVHPYERLRVGATLRGRDGRVLRVVRKKGAKRTLLGEGGAPLPDDTLWSLLGAVDEQLFGSFFAMGYRELRAGGAELLEGKGEVGKSLFGAASGGGQWSRLEAELAEEVNRLFTSERARKQLIPQTLASFEDAQRRIQAASFKASEWERLDGQRRRLTGELGEVTSQQAALRRRQARCAQLRDLAPLVRELRWLQERITASESVAMAGAPGAAPGELAEDARERRLAWTAALDGALQERDECAAELQRLVKESHELLDESAARAARVLVDHREEIESLQGELGAMERARQAIDELRRRAGAQRHQAEATATELWGDCVPPHGAASPTFPQRAQVQQLALAGQRLLSEQAGARQRLAKLEQQLGDVAAERLPLEAAGEPALEPLRRAVQAAHALGPVDVRVAVAQAAVATSTTQRDELAARLGLADRPCHEVVRWPVPSVETCERFERELRETQRALADGVEAETRRNAEIALSRERLTKLKERGDVPTESDLERCRARRDEAWRALRGALERWGAQPLATVGSLRGETEALNALASTVERELRGADALADRLRRESERVAERAQVVASLERLEGEQARSAPVLARLGEQREALEGRWRDLWRPFGLAPLPPPEQRSWVRGHGELVAVALRLAEAEQEVRRLTLQRSAAVDGLMVALAPFVDTTQVVDTGAGGHEARLTPWVDRATALLHPLDARAQQLSELRAREREVRQQLLGEQAIQEGLAAQLDQWRASWRSAIAGLPVEANADPETALLVLQRVEQWRLQLQSASATEGQAEAAEAQLDGLSQRVSALGGLLEVVLGSGLDPTLPAEQRLGAIVARLRQGQELLRKSELVRAQRRSLEGRRVRAEERGARARAGLAELCAQARVGDVSALAEAEERSSERRRWRQRRGELEAQALHQARGEPLAQLEVELADTTEHALDDELAALQRRLDDLAHGEAALRQRLGELTVELAAWDGSAAAASAAEEAQGHLADLDALVRRYTELKAAALLLRHHVERHRRQHEGPLLGMASAYFSRMTAGGFVRIEAELREADEPVLVALRGGAAERGGGDSSGAERVPIEGLSEGTLDQLHLSLRLAYLSHHLDSGAEPLPVVLDDLLVQFDDARALATLEILQELGARTQVLLFTHHRRIVELAHGLGGTARVHALRGA
jgi:uncharacterized protein YhaN